ncbi:cation-translocating P-type ATPase [Mycobacterium tuberculosis]|uniref:cation-translocating P-type ATPase n=1 Tax=Mycobacterium tuberculosis TaxID=1773 RepID=UPI0005EA4583|nr:cation-translocating P-type ATPase [Mycobacterium tuberculosis]MBP2967923.1 cation-translocating P-type ATPase [Mycobacterium tuberculosis]MBP2973247.1 cation-translocating P-type ATPase [Mycobacterium tuberculosis]MBP2992760.1 cation-translocating P-type ATPase [Mycobacterium tuberculosis]CME51554.1 ATPase P [Mycobacterium tuberculosis]
MPVRAVATGFRATATLTGASITAATAVSATLAKTGVGTGMKVAIIPLRAGAKALSGELSRETLGRNCWRGERRAWIEVRGLRSGGDDELGRVVLNAIQAHPGVGSASLNYPLSRVVVAIDDPDTSLRELCRIVDDAEKAERHRHPDQAADQLAQSPGSLPGDGVLLAVRAVTVAATAAGLGLALGGRALRWPRFPLVIEAAVAAVDHQPLLRRLLEDRIGTEATATVLELAMAAAHTVTLSPAALSVDLTIQALKAAECRAGARAWRRHEPQLALHADEPADQPQSLWPRPARSTQPVQRSVARFALIQALSAVLVGAGTRDADMAATATLVATPKASRTTPEAFAAALGQGLADQHAVLPLRPESLRRLDRVDAIVIDPRVLCTDDLRVARIRGCGADELSTAWNRAQLVLTESGLRPGWHRVPGVSASGSDSAVEALFRPMHDRLASAVVAEAHRTGADLVSVDVDALGELRPVFDDIRPLDDGASGSLDEALARAVAELRQAGRTVAVLSSVGKQALSAADVALGVLPPPGAGAPPWYADVLLPDLGAAWRVLHAIPAARAARQRGNEISGGASALGALLMLPGVRGLGPGPVTTGAAAGLLSGYLLARKVVDAQAPRPAPAHEWHAMSVEQVRKALPSPDEQAPAKAPPSPYPARALAGGLHTAKRGAQITQAPLNALWQLTKAVRAELSDPLTPMLALGAMASAVLGSPVDAVMVGSVLTGNSILAASQRLRAESRLNRLLAQQIPPARKVLAGADDQPRYIEVRAEELRPGDIIEVRTHEVVPADARVIEEVDVEVDESALTGESLSVTKQVEPTPGVDLIERRCMLYAGTTVVSGTAVAVVTAVGPDTQERRAAELVSGDLSSVGLQHQLSRLTNQAWPVSMTGGALVTGLGLLRRRGLRQAVASGIAVTVAAVPEGMPLVATLAQQASARRLSHFGALVRIPRSVEALGRVDMVCFDKTGMLSENRLRVAQVRPVAGHSREEVLRCAAHAAPASNGPQVHATDVAIVQAAAAAAASGTDGAEPGAAEPAAHLPFRSGRSFSASVSGTELTVKGAPEVVLAACEGIGSSMDDAVAELAANGLRVIAVAHRQLTAQQAQSVVDDPDEIARLCRDELSLVGFLGLSDTPRAQAAALLADLHEHDLDIRLITGDHPITAAAIAEELGMQVSPEQVISGAEWDALSRKDQERAVAERVIFARMTPENKVQIVQTLEHSGRVCAMVGDGSNDAAAIRAATVGIGVVAHGSDPARVAADLVLVDGRIESLLPAILEGRQLWQRVQAAVSVLLGGNAGEVAFAIIGSAITGTSPLNTRQLLLVNMLTDALPAAALAVSKPSDPVTPATRGPDQRELWRAVGIRGATTAAAATVAWVMAGFTGLPRRASTVALVALVAAQLGQTLVDSHAWLVVLTALGSLAALATLISIPVVSQLLGCTPLDPLGWAQATAAATAATVAVAVLNRVLTGRDKSGQPNPQPPETDALSRDASPGAPPGPRRRRRATARRKAPVKAPSATRQTTKPKGPPAHRSSSTYPRR